MIAETSCAFAPSPSSIVSVRLPSTRNGGDCTCSFAARARDPRRIGRGWPRSPCRRRTSRTRCVPPCRSRPRRIGCPARRSTTTAATRPRSVRGQHGDQRRADHDERAIQKVPFMSALPSFSSGFRPRGAHWLDRAPLDAHLHVRRDLHRHDVVASVDDSAVEAARRDHARRSLEVASSFAFARSPSAAAGGSAASRRRRGQQRQEAGHDGGRPLRPPARLGEHRPWLIRPPRIRPAAPAPAAWYLRNPPSLKCRAPRASESGRSADCARSASWAPSISPLTARWRRYPRLKVRHV